MKFTEEQREKVIGLAVSLHDELVSMFGDKFNVVISAIDDNYIHIGSYGENDDSKESITMWDKELADFHNKSVCSAELSKRMTLRQLSRWLAMGNGEYTTNGGNFVSHVFGYKEDIGDYELYDCFYIRRFGSNEWVEPTYGIFKEDCLNG